MTGTKEVKQLSRSLSHLLKRAVQYSIHLYMNEAGKSGTDTSSVHGAYGG